MDSENSSLEFPHGTFTSSINAGEELFRIVFMANPAAMVITRVADQKLVECNSTFIELTGYTRNEAMGLTSSDLGAWSSLQDRSTYWSLLEKQGKVSDFEFALQTNSGETKTVLISGEIVLVSGQNYLISIFKDITEKKRADEALGMRQNFEQLMVDLSCQFTNMPAEKVDYEIESGLEHIRKYLSVDRVGLLDVSTDQLQVRLTHVSLHELFPLPFTPDTDVVPYFPWLYKHVVQQGNVFCAQSFDDYPPEGAVDRESHRQLNIEAVLLIPLSVGGEIDQLITVDYAYARSWPEELIPRIRVLGEVFANALARKRADEVHKRAFKEIKELKERLQVEAEYLRSEIKFSQSQSEIVGQSQAIQQVLRQVEQVSPTDSIVLITGETGTGKELVARAIHTLSKRQNKLMVTVNCATLPPTLIESELFGREKGAFTGALIRQIGRFELADGGTIFLDEIGELPFELQSKLLRVLQEGEFERLGGPAKTIRVNVRIIAATNKDLAEAVRRGEYRKDLYYRLSVFPIEVPPLRDRMDDIPLLIWKFIEEFGKSMGKKVESVSQRTMDQLMGYSWPGNIRELRNIIERAMILNNGVRLEVEMPKNSMLDRSITLTMEEAERFHIVGALEKTGWRVKGTRGAAVLLGLKPSTLYAKMDKLGIPTRREKDDIAS